MAWIYLLLKTDGRKVKRRIKKFMSSRLSKFSFCLCIFMSVYVLAAAADMPIGHHTKTHKLLIQKIEEDHQSLKNNFNDCRHIPEIYNNFLKKNLSRDLPINEEESARKKIWNDSFLSALTQIDELKAQGEILEAERVMAKTFEELLSLKHNNEKIIWENNEINSFYFIYAKTLKNLGMNERARDFVDKVKYDFNQDFYSRIFESEIYASFRSNRTYLEKAKTIFEEAYIQKRESIAGTADELGQKLHLQLHLGELAEIYKDLGYFEEEIIAIEADECASNIFYEERSNTGILHALNFEKLVIASLKINNTEKFHSYLEKWWRIENKNNVYNERDSIERLFTKVEAHAKAGRFGFNYFDALALFKKIVEIRRGDYLNEKNIKTYNSYINGLSRLQNLYEINSLYANSLEAIDEALLIVREADQSGIDPRRSWRFNELDFLMRKSERQLSLGNHVDALSMQEKLVEGLDAANAKFDAEHPELLKNQKNEIDLLKKRRELQFRWSLGKTYRSLFQNNKAEEQFKLALSLGDTAGNPITNAYIRMSLAQTLINYGRAEEALQNISAILESLEITKNTITNTKTENERSFYLNIIRAFQHASMLAAKARISLEDFDGAELHIKKALSFGFRQIQDLSLNFSDYKFYFEDTWLKEKLNLYSQLAAIKIKQSKFDEALEVAQISLDYLSGNFSEESIEFINVADAYSLANERVGRYEIAFEYAWRALLAAEYISGETSLLASKRWTRIGDLYQTNNDIELAIFAYKNAINIIQQYRLKTYIFDPELGHQFSLGVNEVFVKLAALFSSSGRLAEAQHVFDIYKDNEYFEFVRRTSGNAYQYGIIQSAPDELNLLKIYRELSSRVIKLLREKNSIQILAKQGLASGNIRRLDELLGELEIARSNLSEYQKNIKQSVLKKESGGSEDFEKASVNALNELQGLLRLLGKDVALVQYFSTDARVGVLITTGYTQKSLDINIESTKLARKISDFRSLLLDPRSDPKLQSIELYEQIFAPVAKSLNEMRVRNVMLSLGGGLQYIPFSAFHDGKSYILKRFNFSIYNSPVRDHLGAASFQDWRAAGLGVTRQHGEFPALPAVKKEIDGIIKGRGQGVLSGKAYLDNDFTAHTLYEVGRQRFPVVHIASHFRFSPGTEENSFLLLGDGRRLSLGDLRTKNYRFDGVDLLTLSACETGLGGSRDARGREIEGFGTIAQRQGANAVLATLWKVADDSTSELMTKMYRLRQKGKLTKTEALRQAQQSMLKQSRYAHPYYWAPFILMGNWK